MVAFNFKYCWFQQQCKCNIMCWSVQMCHLSLFPCLVFLWFWPSWSVQGWEKRKEGNPKAFHHKPQVSEQPPSKFGHLSSHAFQVKKMLLVQMCSMTEYYKPGGGGFSTYSLTLQKAAKSQITVKKSKILPVIHCPTTHKLFQKQMCLLFLAFVGFKQSYFIFKKISDVISQICWSHSPC